MKIFDLVIKKLKKKIHKIIWLVKAFTLLELIVVVTLLSILWTISYYSVVWYIRMSRDATRLENLKVIDKAISFFNIEKGYFPRPDNWFEITYSWNILWTQWVFWNKDMNQVWIINKKPVDIMSETDFAYSISNDWKEYELWGLTEWDEVNQFTFFPETNAMSLIPWKSLVFWNYNWKMLKFSSGSSLYLFSFPTILTRDLSNTDVLSILNWQKLAYKWYWNLPASYSWIRLMI